MPVRTAALLRHISIMHLLSDSRISQEASGFCRAGSVKWRRSRSRRDAVGALDRFRELTLARVRRWRKKLLDSGTSPITTAKAYRFLRAVMNTAVDDGLIKRNPCRIKGACSEDSPERRVLSVAQVYRPLILLAAFSSLRWGELAALRPEDIDLDACTVRVTRQLNKPGTVPVFGPPKSRAGRRVVDFADLNRARPAQASPHGSCRCSRIHQPRGHSAV
jgi:integrase